MNYIEKTLDYCFPEFHTIESINEINDNDTEVRTTKLMLVKYLQFELHHKEYLWSYCHYCSAFKNKINYSECNLCPWVTLHQLYDPEEILPPVDYLCELFYTKYSNKQEGISNLIDQEDTFLYTMRVVMLCNWLAYFTIGEKIMTIDEATEVAKETL